MSSKKRRVKRKIAQLVRMDIQQVRFYVVDDIKRDRLIANMRALGGMLARTGYKSKAWAAVKAARAALPYYFSEDES